MVKKKKQTTDTYIIKSTNEHVLMFWCSSKQLKKCMNNKWCLKMHKTIVGMELKDYKMKCT